MKFLVLWHFETRSLSIGSEILSPTSPKHPRLVDRAGRWPRLRIYLRIDGLNRCYSRRGHRHDTGPSVDDVRHSVSSPLLRARLGWL
jgi:hypothetical protein